MKKLNNQKPNGPGIYGDIQAYFKEIFLEQPELPELRVTTGQLISDMEMRFGNKYDPKAIVLLLKNGFEVMPGLYVFNREDFVKENKRPQMVLEEAAQ